MKVNIIETKKEMISSVSAVVMAVAAIIASAGNAPAAATSIPLRLENPGTCIFNGVTVQTLETAFGTNISSLPFSGTTTYDFYSPPLIAPTSLTTSDKGGGVIFMKNTAATSANDFSVAGRMQFFDYDPGTGAEVLIADTSNSPHKDVNHGQTVNWAIPNQSLPANRTVPSGHLLHIAMTLTLMSGDPGAFGGVLYSGPSGSSTVGLLSQSATTTWSFGSLTAPPQIGISLSSPAVYANCSGNIASVPATAGAAYAWTINNGSIAAGQGTPQISWTAGSIGPVTLGVTVTKGCSSSCTTNVTVLVTGSEPAPLLSIGALPDRSVWISCAGVPGQNYLVEATTNLAAPVWTTLVTTNGGTAGLFMLIDLDSTNYPARFYRAVTP